MLTPKATRSLIPAVTYGLFCIISLLYWATGNVSFAVFLVFPSLMAGWFLPLRRALLLAGLMTLMRWLGPEPDWQFPSTENVSDWLMLAVRLSQYFGQVLIAHFAAKQSRTVKGIYQSSVYVLLNAIHARDNYTGSHSVHVALYARTIGQQLERSADEIEELFLGGLLHDVGKIAVREDVLNKPGLLTAPEYAEVQTHPARGVEIVRVAPALDRLAPIIRYHHERMDGKGYPLGLMGQQIPLSARICAVADTFDAVTTDRPYRKAFTAAEAMAELERVSGTQLDPTIVNAFRKVLTQRRFRLASDWPEAAEIPVRFGQQIQTASHEEVASSKLD